MSTTVQRAIRGIRNDFKRKSAVTPVLADVSFETFDTPDALKTAMNIQIAPGNLKKQPSYEKFVVQIFAKKAMAK